MPKSQVHMGPREVPPGHVSVTVVLPRDLVAQVDQARLEVVRESGDRTRPPRSYIIAQALEAWFTAEEVEYVPAE